MRWRPAGLLRALEVQVEGPAHDRRQRTAAAVRTGDRAVEAERARAR